MDEAQRERYLSNPHLKIDAKMAKQLGITTEELTHPANSVAAEIDAPLIPINKQVIVHRRRNDTKDNSTNEDPLQK